MRHSLMLITGSVAIAAAFATVATANADTRGYPLNNFEKVDVSAGIEVILKQGAFDVKVETPNGQDFDKIEINVRGNTLHVGRKSNLINWGPGPHFTVTVSAPNFTGVEASSGSHVDGGGLKLNDMKVGVSSGAHVELAGACGNLSVETSSGAHFDGGDLKCESASVDASSGGHAEAFATRSADGDASSGGHVTFHGQPASLRKNTSSGGSVRSL
ncbi:MAG TPA: head GIN domain-containing protein [Hyphomonadaceae bacterium]|nr:head GIN domain-containing protein [Hyphomonadaceae bacterium]